MSERAGRESEVHRRGFIGGLMAATMGGSLLGASRQTAGRKPDGHRRGADGLAGAPTGSLSAWIFVHSPLEFWMSDYQRTFDAWEAGGVRGIAVGYLP